MAPLIVLADDIGSKWLYWPWVQDHTDEIRQRLGEHIELTVLAVLFGLLIALPLALLSVRYRRLYGPVIAVTGVLYTIPSLALFVMLLPADRALALDRAHPAHRVHPADPGPEHRDRARRRAARREGRRGWAWATHRRARLLRVELPLALPAIIAGIRIATVSTIGLVAITALIGQGGLGALMYDGLQRDFRTPLVVGIVLSLALAVVADLLLVLAQRLSTPWARAGTRKAKPFPAYRPPQVPQQLR